MTVCLADNYDGVELVLRIILGSDKKSEVKEREKAYFEKMLDLRYENECLKRQNEELKTENRTLKAKPVLKKQVLRFQYLPHIQPL